MSANMSKQKKSVFKRWWFWVLIVLIISAVIRPSGDKQEKSSSPKSESSVLSFTLSANNAGEYGQEIVLNSGTESEYKFYGFYIPSGEYTVTNTDKKSSVQLSFCKDGTSVNSDGIEEVIISEQKPIVLSAGETASFSIKDGEFIKLSDGHEVVEFEKK